MTSLFASVDCNSFYASCERTVMGFRKPMIVRSNNDGCIIARSNEAKALGLQMSQPVLRGEGACGAAPGAGLLLQL
ncbi:Y-family DNA polymerase [Pontibacter sp. CAU 1760]